MADINPDLLRDKTLKKLHIENEHSIERMKLERGLLGAVWGTSASIPNNIAASITILLVFTGIIYTLCVVWLSTSEVNLSIKDFWSIITPIITLAVGYLFGNRKSEENT